MDSLQGTPRTVIRCYDLLDSTFSGGISDFTDGKYFGDPTVSYSKAQANQAEWLLDQIHCTKGSTILDVGCGNGRILAAAQKRGAHAVGITISKQQVKRAKAKGLVVHLMDYRNIPEEWNGRFDGIIANGAVEHFPQLSDVLAGRQDTMYRDMFKIFFRVLKPSGWLATTILHFNRSVDPHEIARGSHAYVRGSSNFHFAQLEENFGGWYPKGGQLEECAVGAFERVHREDGTEDYHWTSEYWLQRMKRQCVTNPKVWLAFAGKFLEHPRAMVRIIDMFMRAQSWMWQFRKQENGRTPVVLFRDTWRRIDRS